MFARVVLVLVMVVAGCSTDAAGPAPDQPPPTSVTSTVGLPTSNGIAFTAEQLSRADPCGLLDPRALGGLGRVTIEPGLSFTSCEATIGTDLNGVGSLELAFDDHHSWAKEMTPTERGGVTVYGYRHEQWCDRAVVVGERAVIKVDVRGTDADTPICEMADAAVDGMVPRLTSGQLRPSDLPSNSLAWQDACRVLDHHDAWRVPGIDRTQVHPSYHGENCTWGRPAIDEVNLYVAFHPSFPLRADTDAERRTIAGHDAVVDMVDAVEARDRSYTTKPECQVDVMYRPLDHPTGTLEIEKITLTVSADQPAKTSCPLAIELAGKVLARLPGA